MHQKNLFSLVAKEYGRYRPDYPSSLFNYVCGHVSRFNVAWDAGTGNGQAAFVLSRYFKRVIAVDASRQQIENAVPGRNIEYLVSSAETTTIQEGTVDLITVAQALHWFDHELFYSEVRRVSHRESIIAAWSYGLFSVNEEIDQTVHYFSTKLIGGFWPRERYYVDNRYKTIPFPFKKINSPEFFIEKGWCLSELAGYLATWSGVQNYRRETGKDPLERLLKDLESMWGKPDSKKTVRWPLFLLLGRVQ
jgi:SAM-dependent methyltransferase